MMQGTTPTITWNLPIGADLVAKARAVYKQGDKVVITKEGDKVVIKEVDAEHVVATYTLTQEDTLALEYGQAVKIQLQVLTPGGQVLSTPIYTRSVGECLAGEVLK